MDRIYKKDNQGILRHVHGLDLVRIMLGQRDQMEALAEEAAELSQAALKWIRASGMSENPTPVTFNEAAMNLLEKRQDVMACAYVLGMPLTTNEELVHSEKSERWAQRVMESYEKRMEEAGRKEHAKI